MTDALSRVTSIVLDASANVTAVVNPLGYRTTYTWSGDRLVGITDANGNTTGISYASGLTNRTRPLACISYAGGGCFSFSYDLSNGRVKQLFDEAIRGTTLVWDGDQRTGVIDPLGNRTSYSYNSRGQVETLTNPLGQTTTYAYDSLGQISAVVNPLGERTSFTYNGAGQQQTIQDGLGNVATTIYDLMNHPTVSIDPEGNRTSFTYDLNCLLKTIKNPLGNVTTNIYDANNNLEVTIDPLGNRTSFSHDGVCNPTASTNPLGNTNTNVYDANNNLEATIDPLGNRISFAYDGAGNQTSVKNPWPTGETSPGPCQAVRTPNISHMAAILRAIVSPPTCEMWTRMKSISRSATRPVHSCGLLNNSPMAIGVLVPGQDFHLLE